MNKNPRFDLHYFLNDASFINWAKLTNENDIEYWNSWIVQHPQYIEIVEDAKSIIVGIKFHPQLPSTLKVNDELSKVLPKIEKSLAVEKNHKSKGLLKWLIYYSAAAIALFLLSWSSISFYNNYTTTIHKTNFGEIIDLKLSDGTTVVLNGNSEISYKKNNPRLLSLKGEAYFKVKSIPSTNAKFWVVTNDLRVEVLGTQFHVNSRKKNTKVVLDEGAINLAFKNGAVTKMIPGELVSFSKESEQLVHEKVSTETSYALWRGGTYTFNEIPLKEVMFNLEYTYGVTVAYASEELKELRISGGIPNQNLKICVAAIEKATGTRIVHNDNILLIKENPIN